MSEANDPFKSGDRKQIREELTRQFLRGGVSAIVVFVGVVGFVVTLWVVSLLLPPESKEAEDPTPDSFGSVIETPAPRLKDTV